MYTKEAMREIYYLINADGNQLIFSGAVDEIIAKSRVNDNDPLSFEEVVHLLTIVDGWYKSDQFITEDKLKKYRMTVFRLISLYDAINKDYITKFFGLIDCDIIPFYLFISHDMGDLISDKVKTGFFDFYFSKMRYNH